MKTLRDILQENGVKGIETFEPELHTLCVEAGYNGLADLLRKHPALADISFVSVRKKLINQILGLRIGALVSFYYGKRASKFIVREIRKDGNLLIKYRSKNFYVLVHPSEVEIW